MGSIEQLKQQTGLVKKSQTFQQMLEGMKGQIQLVLPRHLDAGRMVRIALTSWRTNPRLAECDPQSIIASVMIASQLGLEPGIFGQCYLVPYKNRAQQKMFCQLIPGWMGIMDLVNRSNKASAWTGAVYVGDEFDWQIGSEPRIIQKPCGNDDPNELTHVWAVSRTKNSQWPILEVWPIQRVWKHRDKVNKVGEDHYSFKWPEQYARKVVLLQVLKYVPRSIELNTALSIDETAEMGGQQLSIKDAATIIDGGAVTIREDAPEPRIAQKPNGSRVGPTGEEMPEFDEPVQTSQVLKPDAKKGVRVAEVCSECRKEGGAHEAECKFAAPVPGAPKQPKKETKPKPEPKPHQTPEWQARNRLLWAKANSDPKIPEDDIRIWAKEQYGQEHLSDLTYDQLKGVIGWIDYIHEEKKGW